MKSHFQPKTKSSKLNKSPSRFSQKLEQELDSLMNNIESQKTSVEIPAPLDSPFKTTNKNLQSLMETEKTKKEDAVSKTEARRHSQTKTLEEKQLETRNWLMDL